MTALQFVLCVPTCNAGNQWQDWITAYQSQSLKADKVIVIDSSSSDNTVKLAEEAGFQSILFRNPSLTMVERVIKRLNLAKVLLM